MSSASVGPTARERLAPSPTASMVDRALVPLTAAVVTILSVWGLTRQGLWLDEAVSLGATHQLGETLWRTAGTMGLYYVLLDLWTGAFGSSVLGLRALSVACAAGATVVTVRLARHVLRRPEAVATAVVVATSVGLVRYAQEVRSYALLALLTATAWATTRRAVVDVHHDRPYDARRWWRVLTIVSVVGVATHGLFPLQLVAIIASLLVPPRRRELVEGILPAVIGTAVAVAVLSMLGATDVADWVPALRPAQLGAVVGELVSPAPLAAAVLLALALVGAMTLLRRGSRDPVTRWQELAPIAWAVIPFLVLVTLSAVRPYLVPRYLLASVPGLAMLVGVGAVRLATAAGRKRASGRSRRTMAASGVALVLVASIVVGQTRLHDRDGDDWSAAAEQVAQGARPGDGIAFPSVPLRMPFEAAWRDVDADDTPVAVWTARPLGQVRRFDETSGDAALAADLQDLDRLWIVHQTTEGAGDGALQRFLDFPTVRDDFTVVERRRGADDIEVILLARN